MPSTTSSRPASSMASCSASPPAETNPHDLSGGGMARPAERGGRQLRAAGAGEHRPDRPPARPQPQPRLVLAPPGGNPAPRRPAHPALPRRRPHARGSVPTPRNHRRLHGHPLARRPPPPPLPPPNPPHTAVRPPPRRGWGGGGGGV